MVGELEAAGAIITGAVLLFVGYLLNGRLQRKVEKQTTSYHVKLDGFRDANRAIVRLIQDLKGLRNVFAIARSGTFSEEDVSDLAWQMERARDAEIPGAMDSVDKMARDLEEASDTRGEALQDWADATWPRLANLYSRAFEFHTATIDLQAAQVNLVSDSEKEEVNAAFDKFRDVVGEYSADATAGAKPGAPSLDEVHEEVTTLMKAWSDLVEAMREELRGTL